MSKSLIIVWQYVRAFVLIYACLYAGEEKDDKG